MNDATKPTRTRNALTLEQFYRLCQWLHKWQETFEPSDTMEKLLVDASKEIGCLITTAHMERAISVTGIKPPFMTAADRAAAEAAKTARAEKAGPRLLAALKHVQPWLRADDFARTERSSFLDAAESEALDAIAEAEGE
jgi:hypothetical protein